MKNQAVLLAIMALGMTVASGGVAHGARIAAFDHDLSTTAHVQSGFQRLIDDDTSGPYFATQNGITLTVSDVPHNRDRDRGTGGGLSGHPLTSLLRDHTHPTGSNEVILDLSGLNNSTEYTVRVYSYDRDNNDNAVSSWYKDSVGAGNLLTTSRIRNVQPGNADFQFNLTSSAGGTLTIVGDGNPVNFNGLEVFDVAAPPPEGVKINFQQGGADDGALPPGYLIDTGDAYGDRGNGFSYGWNPTNTGNDRNRNNGGPLNGLDERYDTLNHFQNGSDTLYDWRIALPNDRYNVVAVMGDPTTTDVNDISIEGQQSFDPDPNVDPDQDTYHAIVNLSDGELNIAQIGGGAGQSNKNAKIHYVEIHESSDQLSVDFGSDANDIALQAEFLPFESASDNPSGTSTRTFAAHFGTNSGTVDVSVFTTSTQAGTPAHGYRDRADASIAGAVEDQIFLLSDLVKTNSLVANTGFETLHLQLDNLAPGIYEITTFHHDSSFPAVGDIDIILDDANGTNTLFSSFSQSGGTDVTNLATATFRFLVDQTGTATIRLVEIDGTAANEEALLNGFVLTFYSIPEPSTFALAAIGLLGLMGWRRRRR
jgi:hypothetical protein